MFGRPSKKKRKHLEENGVRATAVVIDTARRMAVSTGPDNVVSSTEIDVHLTLRIEPEGQTPMQVECRMRFPQTSEPGPGSRIPVIYDPDDPNEIMYDDTATGIGTLVGNDSVGELAEMAMGGAGEQELIDAAMKMFPGATVGPGGGAVIDLRAQGAEVPQAGGDPQVADLERLAALHESGALTDEEYAAAKARLLGGS